MPNEKEKDTEGLDKALFKIFTVKKLVGKGAYGIVWKVVEKETGRTVALKKCFDAFQNSTDAQRTFREIMFLTELNGHENIVRLLDVMKSTNNQDLYVVFDSMDSDLQYAITESMLQGIHVEYVTYQVLKALKYIHSGGVLHRDLKPANVLLNANCHVRLCDFGLARTFHQLEGLSDGSKTNSVMFTDYVATRWYRAPELLLGANKYREHVDMWSVGCIIGEMYSGRPILKGRSTIDQLTKICELTGKPSEQDMRPISSCSPCAKQLLEQLGNVRQLPSSGILFLLKAPAEARALCLAYLKFNPLKRPSAEVSLEDPFVEKFHLQEAEPLCDKIIRMPISDTTKVKADDYRSHLYYFISQRQRMRSEAEGSTSAGSTREDLHGSWATDSGAQAPPVTPR